MKPNSIEKLKQAENFMNAAAGLLDSVVSVEWPRVITKRRNASTRWNPSATLCVSKGQPL